MKVGLGLYRHMLNRQHYDFAKQCGCTHIVVHMVDYLNRSSQENRNDQPIGGDQGWGFAGDPDIIWSAEELIELKKEINAAGLELEAIENFDPAHWYDILLDGPHKKRQMENLKQLIRNVGKAGIPIFGYCFTIAGLSGRITGNFARGNARSVGMDSIDERPIPNGMVWNMIYDRNPAEGFVPVISNEELWQRFSYFLAELVPVAEEAGVKLAAHPDDPPLPFLRGMPRLLHKPEMFEKYLQIKPSPNNKLEFCVGTIGDTPDCDIYEVTEKYASQIGYVHFRNVKGKAPKYREVFIDEGDVDMIRILKILKANNFGGVIIPDHTPQMSCEGPWYAGMAYALGYINAAIKLI